MHDLAACGMVAWAQCGLGGDRLPPGTGVGVDRKTRAGGGRAAAAVRAAGRGRSDGVRRLMGSGAVSSVLPENMVTPNTVLVSVALWR